MTLGRVLAQIGGLWALAVAHPALDSFARAPEFFTAHRSDPIDLTLFAAGIAAGPPLLAMGLVAGARLFGRPCATAAAGTVLGGLAAALAVQLAFRAGVEGWLGTAATGAVVWVAVSLVWLRLPAVQTFCTALSPAALVVPVLFLTSSGIRPLLWPAERASASLSARAASTPVVLVVLDEIPLVSLLDERDELDARLYPNIAALAADGIWFRNATTVSTYTRWAIPAILTGRYPSRADAGAGHPENLFTLLAATHRLEVFEWNTALCPADLCRPVDVPRVARLAAILRDLRVVVAHVLLPPVARDELPDLTADWAGFGDQGQPGGTRSRSRAPRRLDAVREFLGGIAAADPQPTLYFIHSLVSHRPSRWLPSGQAIADWHEIPGQLPRGLWAADDWSVAQHYRRHLWQVGFADAIVGELRARLKVAGLYDRALIVLVADHGISYPPGERLRWFSERTVGETMPVPLIVRLPAGTGPPPGTVDDRNVEVIDILPIIAAHLGIAVPWQVDGRPVFGEGPERPAKRLSVDEATAMWQFTPEQMVRFRRGALDRKIALFGSGRWPIAAPAPTLRAIIGRPVNSLTIVNDPTGSRIVLRNPARFRAVDLDGPVLPVEVAGRLVRGPGRRAASVYLAVAVNGKIAGTTRTWPDGETWMAPLDPGQLRQGRNDVEVFFVDPAAPERLYRPVTRAAPGE